MRFHLQERPWDLYIAVGYTGIIAAILLGSNAGNLLAIFLILLVPGYVSVAALFPGSSVSGKQGIDWIERIALSFSLSIAVVPFLGMFLNFTPWGLRFAPIVVIITLFTAGAGVLAYRRRMRLPPQQRLSATLDLAWPAWNHYPLFDRILTIFLTAMIVLAAGTLAYVSMTPRRGETFTEFYILGPSGNTSGYPTALNVSQPGTLILVIMNHESASLNYTVRVDLVGVRLVYNATSGHNETLEVNRTTWSTLNVTLADGQNLTERYAFSIPSIGLWKVQLSLFKNGDYSSVYRELHLYVTVS